MKDTPEIEKYDLYLLDLRKNAPYLVYIKDISISVELADRNVRERLNEIVRKLFLVYLEYDQKYILCTSGNEDLTIYPFSENLRERLYPTAQYNPYLPQPYRLFTPKYYGVTEIKLL